MDKRGRKRRNSGGDVDDANEEHGGSASAFDRDEEEQQATDSPPSANEVHQVTGSEGGTGQRQAAQRSAGIKLRDVTPMDVVCGRGFQPDSFQGNLRMHELTDAYREQYLSCTKRQKGSLVKWVIQQIQDAGGRFLKLQSQHRTGITGDPTGAPPLELSEPSSPPRARRDFLLEVVDEETAYKKVSHAFRCHRRRHDSSASGRDGGASKDNLLLRRHVGNDEGNDSNDSDRKPPARDSSQLQAQPAMSFLQASQIHAGLATPTAQMDPRLVTALLSQGSGTGTGGATMSSAVMGGGQTSIQNPHQSIEQTLTFILAQQQMQAQAVPQQVQQPLLQNAILSWLASARLSPQQTLALLSMTGDAWPINQSTGPGALPPQVQWQNHPAVLSMLAQQQLPSSMNASTTNDRIQLQQHLTGAPSMSQMLPSNPFLDSALTNLAGGNRQLLQQQPSHASSTSPRAQMGMTLAMNQHLVSLLQQAAATTPTAGDADDNNDATQGQQQDEA